MAMKKIIISIVLSGFIVIKHLSMSFVLILEKHPIRMSHQIDTAFLLDDFVLILEKHPIKMSYPMDTAF